MNEKCKYCDYVSKCSRSCEYGSILCTLNRSFPKIVNKSYEQLQEENKKQNGRISFLEDNWNKLKEYIDTVFQWYSYSYGNEGCIEAKIAKEILNEMQKLEKGSDANVKMDN